MLRMCSNCSKKVNYLLLRIYTCTSNHVDLMSKVLLELGVLRLLLGVVKCVRVMKKKVTAQILKEKVYV